MVDWETTAGAAARPVAGCEGMMPQTMIVVEFGANEEAAQQARHRLEGWRQAFRLGDRLKFKFEREGASTPSASRPATGEPDKATRGKPAAAKKADVDDSPQAEESDGERVRLLVRLDFSSHEKLSYQQWFERLGAEPSLQGTDRQVLRPGQEGFQSATETFDSLP